MTLLPAHPANHVAVTRLWGEMNRQKASPVAVERKSGVTARAMRYWRDGARSAKLAEIEACLNVLGYRLEVVPLDV